VALPPDLAELVFDEDDEDEDVELDDDDEEHAHAFFRDHHAHAHEDGEEDGEDDEAHLHEHDHDEDDSEDGEDDEGSAVLLDLDDFSEGPDADERLLRQLQAAEEAADASMRSRRRRGLAGSSSLRNAEGRSDSAGSSQQASSSAAASSSSAAGAAASSPSLASSSAPSAAAGEGAAAAAAAMSSPRASEFPFDAFLHESLGMGRSTLLRRASSRSGAGGDSGDSSNPFATGFPSSLLSPPAPLAADSLAHDAARERERERAEESLHARLLRYRSGGEDESSSRSSDPYSALDAIFSARRRYGTSGTSGTGGGSSSHLTGLSTNRADYVRVKTEPVDEGAAASSSGASARLVQSPVSPQMTAALPFVDALLANTANLPAAPGVSGADSPSGSVGELLTRSPSAFVLLQQQQLLANVPSTILFLFGVVEEKLGHLRALARTNRPGQQKPAATTSSSAAASASPVPRAGSSPAPAPGSIAAQRALVDKIKTIHSVLDAAALSKTTSTATAASTATRSSSGGDEPSASADSGTTGLPAVTDASFADESASYRTVLVHALTTIAALCRQARAMQASVDAARGVSEKEQAAAVAANAGYAVWFPSQRAAVWKLLICESLQFLDASSGAPTAAGPSGSASSSSSSSAATSGSAAANAATAAAASADLARQLHTILTFLCAGSDAEAWLLRDTFTYEFEFTRLLGAFGLEGGSSGSGDGAGAGAGEDAAEKLVHVSTSTGRIESSSFTRWDAATAERMATHVFARRSLPYPVRAKLLSALRRIDALAAKRGDSFLAFVLNKSAMETSAAPNGANDDAERSKSPAATASSPVPARAPPSPSPSPAPVSSGSASASAGPPRAKLVYLLYLLSVYLCVDDEEMGVVLSLLAIVAEYAPQDDSNYLGAKRRESGTSVPPVLAPIASDSAPRGSASPPPSSSPATVAAASSLFRSASGTTIMSLLNAPQGLDAIDEDKDMAGREGKEAEMKDSEEKEEEEKKEQPAVGGNASDVESEPPTLLAPLFAQLLSYRPELLLGFIQRHLLASSSKLVRTSARAFLFLTWRSLPSAALRRHFFNRVLCVFLDGAGAPAAAAAAAQPGVAATPTAGGQGQVSLAFYGDHAREYLSLFQTLILDSRHAHGSNSRKDGKSATPTASSADEGAAAMDLDDDDAEAMGLMRRSTSSPAGSERPSPSPVPVATGVDGLTAADCSAALRRLLDCTAAQAASFTAHPLAATYAKLATYFDLAPAQHYLQNCVCSVCNSGRATASAADSAGDKASSSGSSGAIGVPKHRGSIPYSSYSSYTRYSGGDASSGASGLTMHSLKDLSVEQKFTHCSRAIRLGSTQTIHMLVLKCNSVPQPPPPASSGSSSSSSSSARHRGVIAADGSSLAGTALKHIRRIDIYFADRTGVELSALPLPAYITRPGSSSGSSSNSGNDDASRKGNDHWTLALSVEINATTSRDFDVRIPFPLGLDASALLIHFATFHEHYGTLNEPIVCPRCQVPVASRTSQCSRCHETVGQCTGCRAIDYEHPDAFLCSECSRSRYGTFTFLVQCKPSTRVPPISDEAQRKQTMQTIGKLQDKIHALLRDDMRRVKNRIEDAWEQGAAARSGLDVAAGADVCRASSSTRRRGASASASASTLSTPSTAAQLRAVWESDAVSVHSRLTELYRELQQNRAELFLYLHHSPFSVGHNLQLFTVASDANSTAPSSLPRAGATAATSCFTCAKQFLLLSLATLDELSSSSDCVSAAHLAGASSSRTASDLDLLAFFLSRSTSSPGGSNPFALEAAFVREKAAALMQTCLMAPAALMEQDGKTGALAAKWVQQVLERHIARILQQHSEVDRIGGVSDGPAPELLLSLSKPLLHLCGIDFLRVARPDPATASSLDLVSISARVQTLYRLLLVALYSEGPRSSSVVSELLLPIISLLVRITSPLPPAPDKEKDNSTTSSRSSKKQMARRGKYSAPSSAAAGADESLRQLVQLQEQLGRIRSAQDLSMSGEELRVVRDQARDLARQVRNAHSSVSALSSTSGLGGSSAYIAAAQRALDAVNRVSAASEAIQRIASGSSVNISQLSRELGASASHLPIGVPASLRRSSGSTGSASGGAAPSRRSHFQRSPGMHPSSVSPGSSRLGRAGRVALGSASSSPVPSASTTSQKDDATPSSTSASSALPPLSLKDAPHVRLLVLNLASDVLDDLCAAMADAASASSDQEQLPAWLRDADPAANRTALATLDVFQKGLNLGERTGSRSQASSSFVSAGDTLFIGPHRLVRPVGAASPLFPLRALLFCPLSVSLRKQSAQLLWNLALPALSAQVVAEMTYRPPSKRKAKSASGSTAKLPVMNLADNPRAEAIAFGLLSLLREVPSSSLLFSLPYFTLLTHMLHSSGAVGVELKQRLSARGILPLLVTRFHAELLQVESEERGMDFISHAQGLSSVPLSSGSVHAQVHRHHGLYGLSMLLSCLLSDASVLSSFASLGSSLSSQVMSFFLRSRGLMLAHSSWLDKCAANLAAAVHRLFNSTGSEEEKKNTLRAYIFALAGRPAAESEQSDAAANGAVSMDMDSASSSASAVSTSAPLTPHISLYILERLCALIKPPQLERQCLVTFKKSPTQEEFIRGNMKRAPYLSSSFLPPLNSGGAAAGGPAAAAASSSGAGAAAGASATPVVLMRHVKDAICTHLKLPNEENMIELLVGGKIVGLDVPLLRMYTNWNAAQNGDGGAKASGNVSIAGTSSSFARTSNGVLLVQASPSMSPHAHSGEGDDGDAGEDGDDEWEDLLSESQTQHKILLAGDMPMQITYRLTGLDGEATEEKIDSIPEDDSKAQDPEEEFSLAGALGEQGLRVLLRRLDDALPDAQALSEDVQLRLVRLLIKLIDYAGKIRANRALLLRLQPPSELEGVMGSAPAATAVPYCFTVLLGKLILTLQALDASSTPSAASVTAAGASSGGSASAATGAASVSPSPLLSLSVALVNVLSPLLHEYASEGGRAYANYKEDLRSKSSGADAAKPGLAAASEQLRTLLESVALPSVRAHNELYHRCLSLVPLLTFGEAPLLAAVAARFARGLDLSSYDSRSRVGTEADDLDALVSLVEEFPRGRMETPDEKGASSAGGKQAAVFVPSPLGTTIRDYFFHSTDLVQQCFSYLQQAASSSSAGKEGDAAPAASPPSKKKRARDADQIESSLTALVARPALPYVLRLLTSFSYGHAATQSLAASKSSALRILQQLEGMASSSRVGPLAESLLQALMLNNDAVSQAVDELRGQKKQQKKQRALDQRAKMLKQMGFASPAGGSKGAKAASAVVPSAFASGLESLSDSGHAHVCLVCQEGYEFAPSLTLGFYVYQHQADLAAPYTGEDDSSAGGEDGAGITTVTHFNLIHHRCHQEACKADKKLKPPKSEWEGATIRNQHTLCNNLFPIFPPPASLLAKAEVSKGAAAAAAGSSSSSVSALLDPSSSLWDSGDIDASFDTYSALVESYWQHCAFHHFFVHSRVELAIEDTRTLISRFALQESFSELAKGGGKESNIQFLPYLVQMTIFLAQTSAPSSVKDRLEGHMTTVMQLTGGLDTAMPQSPGGVATRSSSSTGGRSGGLRFSSLPFINPDAFGSPFLSSSSSSSSSGSAAAAGSNASSASGSSAGSVPSLSSLLSSSPLEGFVPSSFQFGGQRIRGSLYADSSDFLEAVMTMSLSYLTGEQWRACRFGLLWRIIVAAQDGLHIPIDDENSAAADAGASASVAAAVAKPDEDMGVRDSSAALASAAAAASASEQKESEQKEGEPSAAAASELNAAQKAAVATGQLEVLRPLLLFWWLIDSLHSVLSPPADAPYAASQSESFVSSTSSAWYRRWRRGFTRAGSLATFRSLLRRETEILRELTGTVLPRYEQLCQMKDVLSLVDAVGASEALAKEGFTVPQLLDRITVVVRS